jgi:AAA domain
VLPPTDRFDVLTRLLGATAAEQGGLATARDQVEEHRRGPPPTYGRLYLPAAPTRLLGRDTKTRAVVDLLTGSGSRLVTLTGPGGVGKTRLALEAAEQVAPHFGDGVAFVSLAAVRDPGLAVATIAEALGLRELGARPLTEILHHYLRARRVLLVLDNAEHLLPAVPQLGTLLAAAPRLWVLVTSRSPLRLQAEQVYSVAAGGPSGGRTVRATRHPGRCGRGRDRP